MPDETPKPNQEISAGDGSQNYQAARDIHVHKSDTAKPESPIIKPSMKAIRLYDSKTDEVMRVAERWMHLESHPMHYRESSSAYVWIIWAILAVVAGIAMYYFRSRLF
jgi:hypothetical protein